MAGICTAVSSPNSCGHYVVTVTLDGAPVTLSFTDVIDTLTPEETEKFVRFGVRRLRNSGVSFSGFLNRVTHGDEATSVRMYDFFGPGATITKTNIGTTYINICPGANGERIVVDFTGCTEYRFILSANLVGTGQWGARCIRDSDSVVLHESANLGAAGERELDTGWQPLPAAFTGQGPTFLRVQGKSQTAADDPVFRRCVLGLK